MASIGAEDALMALFLGAVTIALLRHYWKGGGSSSDPDSADFWDTEQFWRDYFDKGQ